MREGGSLALGKHKSWYGSEIFEVYNIRKAGKKRFISFVSAVQGRNRLPAAGAQLALLSSLIPGFQVLNSSVKLPPSLIPSLFPSFILSG